MLMKMRQQQKIYFFISRHNGREQSTCPVRFSICQSKPSNLPDKCPMSGANLQACIRVGLFEGNLKKLIFSIFQLPRYHEAIVVQEEKKVKTENQILNFLFMPHTRKDN